MTDRDWLAKLADEWALLEEIADAAKDDWDTEVNGATSRFRSVVTPALVLALLSEFAGGPPR